MRCLRVATSSISEYVTQTNQMYFTLEIPLTYAKLKFYPPLNASGLRSNSFPGSFPVPDSPITAAGECHDWGTA